ncbi:MAG: hypothetical protein EBU52_00140 [Cytophagia bacterium]|nr:hypothetical protein [Cytophagia bacterium]
MRNTIIVTILLFAQCSANDKNFVLIDSELIDSRQEYEQENKRILDCVRMGLQIKLRADSSSFNNDLNSLFEKLNQIFITKDSLIKSIQPGQAHDESIELLERFKTTALNLHRPKYPIKHIQLYFEQDLEFIRANIKTLPVETHPELFKHIIERWTNETYSSFLQSWALDYPC